MFLHFTHFLRINEVRAPVNMQLLTPNDYHRTATIVLSISAKVGLKPATLRRVTSIKTLIFYVFLSFHSFLRISKVRALLDLQLFTLNDFPQNRNHSLEYFCQIRRKSHYFWPSYTLVPSFSTCFENFFFFTHF